MQREFIIKFLNTAESLKSVYSVDYLPEVYQADSIEQVEADKVEYIYIKDLKTKKQFKFRAEGSIQDLKNQLSGLIKIEPNSQRLLLKGKVLANSTLISSFFQNNCLLNLSYTEKEINKYPEFRLKVDTLMKEYLDDAKRLKALDYFDQNEK